ncbi:hypothetical protein CsSME_00036576 [Camellia sinensis var. sinensis]
MEEVQKIKRKKKVVGLNVPSGIKHRLLKNSFLLAHRESTGTILSGNGHILDPVAAAEEIAFCGACARFGLGLYLYHEE